MLPPSFWPSTPPLPPRRQRRRPTTTRPRRGWTTRLSNDHHSRATHRRTRVLPTDLSFSTPPVRNAPEIRPSQRRRSKLSGHPVSAPISVPHRHPSRLANPDERVVTLILRPADRQPYQQESYRSRDPPERPIPIGISSFHPYLIASPSFVVRSTTALREVVRCPANSPPASSSHDNHNNRGRHIPDKAGLLNT